MSLTATVIGYVETRDHRIMQRVNGWRAPRWFRWAMLIATRLGDGWLWYVLGVVLLLRGGTHKYAALGCSAAAALSGILLFLVLKKVCHRKRPCHIAAHCWASVRPPDQFSFPSGHTITAFAIAFSTGFFYPALFAPLLVAAIAIGMSRVVLGMHFVSDVLIGAALGTGLACASYHLIR